MTGEQPQRRDESAGAPRSAYASNDEYVSIRKGALDILGSWEAAGVWQRLGYLIDRHGADGEWRASLAEVADEVWLSLHKTRRAVDQLREVGWITTRPTSVLDSTLIWSMRWEDETPSVIQQPGDAKPGSPLRNASAKGEEIPQPSSTKREETTKTHASADASAIERVIEHHGNLVAAWGRSQRVTEATHRVAAALIDEYGVDVVISLISWAQADDFWRTRTATLSKVKTHAPTLREQRREQRSKGSHKPQVSAEHAARVGGLF